MTEKHHTVFVYGSLKRGFHNHRFLATAKFVSEAVSCDRFAMWGSSFPYLVSKSRGNRVAGELYRIDDATLAELDRLEGVPHHYRRVSRFFRVGKTRRRALVYLADHHNWVDPDFIVNPDEHGILEWKGRRL